MYSFESPILDHILSVDLTLSVVISGFVGMVKTSLTVGIAISVAYVKESHAALAARRVIQPRVWNVDDVWTRSSTTSQYWIPYS